MKKFLVLLVAMVMMFSLVGCKKEADDLKYIEKNGKLVIGITIYSPMNYYDENGKLVIKGEHEFVGEISEGLKKRLIENGMPQDWLDRICRGEAVEC